MRFNEFKILTELADVKSVQNKLNMFNFNVVADGSMNTSTRDALKTVQTYFSLPITGEADDATVGMIDKILKANPDMTATKKTSSNNGQTSAGDGDNRSGSTVSDADIKALQDPDFNKKLNKVADSLGVKSNDLLAIMKLESGVDPSRVNPMSGATGLIQFIPSTAAWLGTSVEELRKMSAVEQLDYVYKYFKMIGIKPGMSVGDLYLAVFYPAALGHDDDHVISANGGKVYSQNKVLDTDRDGNLTVGDVKKSVERFV